MSPEYYAAALDLMARRLEHDGQTQAAAGVRQALRDLEAR